MDRHFRVRVRRAAAIGLVALLVPLPSAIAQTRGGDGDPTVEQLSRGDKIFRRACAACHGVQGMGDGPGAADLDPPPRDLTSRGLFRFRTTPNGTRPRPEDLVRTVREGLPGSSMPAFDDLFSDAELDDLIAFLYSLQGLRSDERIPEPLALADVPASSPELVEQGHALYLLVGCWRCHGLRGAGNGPSGKTLTDEQGRPMPSTDFRHAPFKGGRTPEAVVRALRTGLNGTPMPSYDEAMMLVRSDVGDMPSLEGQVSTGEQAVMEGFLRDSPTREQMDGMSDADKAMLRDRRLAALAHYVLSFGTRDGLASKLFRQEPEKEPRTP